MSKKDTRGVHKVHWSDWLEVAYQVHSNHLVQDTVISIKSVHYKHRSCLICHETSAEDEDCSSYESKNSPQS